MPIHEYWEGNVYLVEAYRKAFRLKQKQEDYNNYMRGLYNFHAFGTVMSNFHLDGKRHKTNNYLSEPFGINDEEEMKLKAEKKAEQEKQKLIAYLNSLKSSWDRKHKEGNNNGTTNR